MNVDTLVPSGCENNADCIQSNICGTVYIDDLVEGLRAIGETMTQEWLDQAGETGRALDLGCGTGTNLELFAEAGCEVAGIDQASTQWTLAILFDLLRERLSARQHQRAVEIMQRNLVESTDWIVLNNHSSGRSAK